MAHLLPFVRTVTEKSLRDKKVFGIEVSGAKVGIYAPVVGGRKGEYLAEFQKWIKRGYTRARIDGEWIDLENSSFEEILNKIIKE